MNKKKKNIALIIGKKKSMGVKKKNIRKILGRPSAEYAFIVAKNSIIDETFVSTDCPIIKKIGKKYHAHIIDRPPILATPESLTEDVLEHALNIIKKKFKSIETISLLMSNNPGVDVNLLNKAIKILKKNKNLDSCFSVAKYNMFSPNRAKIIKNGMIKEYDKRLNKSSNVNSIRSSQGDIYFCDLSIQIMRPRVIEKIAHGQPPLKWLGKKSKAIFVDYGFDVDTEWQFKAMENLLTEKGYTKSKIPW
jgi:CMP-N-acetylneuraminic acid synthetase